MSTFEDIYNLRQNFTVIGLTGRTGSGCSKFAELLSKSDLNSVKEISYFRNPIDFKTIKLKSDYYINDNFERKYNMVFDFITYKKRWKKYKVVKYRDVILFLILKEFCNDLDGLKKIINKFYYDKIKGEDAQKQQKENIIQSLELFFDQKENILSKLKQTENKKELEIFINKLFLNKNENEEKKLLIDFDKLLIGYKAKDSYSERTLFLHRIACYLRGYESDYKIYHIVEFINTIIKAARKDNSGKKIPCHVVIDSLRNSLEIMYLKERYAAFYMISVKGLRRKSRLVERLKSNLEKKEPECEQLANMLLELDETEYKTDDFGKGELNSPDVQNCIAQSDIHIFNSDESELIKDIKSDKKKFINYFKNYFDQNKKNVSNELGRGFNSFFSLSEQALKLQALIQQPGIIGPSHIEHCMQLAYSSRLNSGCISRQVGAVVTDSRYSVKAIGWNEAASGATPCKYRDVTKLAAYESNSDDELNEFSDFEKGIALDEYDNEEEFQIKSAESKEFKQFLKDSYSKIEKNGKPCSFCFKKTYNEFKGDKNQVHTRSLHAEENAMLQISKYGGQSLKGGYLFTTASPCELCAKKAYQIGISSIFYIDPYPGISKSHILKSNPKKDPEMVFFVGAIGRGYHQLYEPFMAYKDEMLTENKIKFKRDEKDFKKDIIGKFKGQFDLEEGENEKLESEIKKLIGNFKNKKTS